MSRHLRHFAFAAAAACACGVLTAAAPTAAGAATAATTATTATAASTTGVTIHQVLGGGHVSPYAGQTVTAVPGEVTDVISSGFYVQDPHPVGGPFKQAIEVYTGSKPTVAAGDDVTVTGK
jgi:predicted extracellular nuclease